MRAIIIAQPWRAARVQMTAVTGKLYKL